MTARHCVNALDARLVQLVQAPSVDQEDGHAQLVLFEGPCHADGNVGPIGRVSRPPEVCFSSE